MLEVDFFKHLGSFRDFIVEYIDVVDDALKNIFFSVYFSFRGYISDTISKFVKKSKLLRKKFKSG